MSDKNITETATSLAALHPLNIYPSMLGMFVGGYLVYDFSIAIASLAGFCIAFGGSSFITNLFFRKSYFLHIALAEHNEKKILEHFEYITSLKKQLQQLNCTEGATQLNRLIGKGELFTQLAMNRFGENAMAFKSFDDLSTDIMTTCYKRYDRMVEQLQIASQIDEIYCNERIATLEQTSGSDGEISDLRSHLVRKGSALRRVQVFMANNEQAISKLSETMHNFDEADDDREIAWALDELKGLSVTLGMIKDDGEITL